MMRSMVLAVSLIALASPALAQSQVPASQAQATNRTPAAEIDALIDRVAKSRGVVFIRNGQAHGAKEAAAHLQRKRKAAGKRIRTPEQFIEHLGTGSSMTGRPYKVRLPDGREMDSADWLNQLLREVRATP